MRTGYDCIQVTYSPITGEYVEGKWGDVHQVEGVQSLILVDIQEKAYRAVNGYGMASDLFPKRGTSQEHADNPIPLDEWHKLCRSWLKKRYGF